jgi:hypothetical protein
MQGGNVPGGLGLDKEFFESILVDPGSALPVVVELPGTKWQTNIPGACSEADRVTLPANFRKAEIWPAEG